jgi:hypothetical protein
MERVNSYYAKHICKEHCEKYNTPECVRDIEIIEIKREKIKTVKCRRYKRIVEENLIEKES